MLEQYRRTVLAQYEGALTMMRELVSRCPDGLWREEKAGHATWQVAYHALYYVDFYLTAGEGAFQEPEIHQPDFQFLGERPCPPYGTAEPEGYLDRPALLGYVQHCLSKARRVVPGETAETLAGPSGFHWLPFPRAETHLYNLRHLQHHIGQLAERLRVAQGEGPPWVAYGWR